MVTKHLYSAFQDISMAYTNDPNRIKCAFRRYGLLCCAFNACRFRLFTENIVVLNSAELIRKALLEQGDVFAGRPTIFRIKYGFHFADDLIFGNYSARWLETKRKVASTLRRFTSGLGCIDTILEEEMENMVELLDKQIPKDRFDPTLILQTAVVNAISATVILISNSYRYDACNIVSHSRC